MKLVFMLEERSMKELLDALLPRILPDTVTFLTIPHEGKSDLARSLPNKLRGWNEPDVAFVVVHDQDSNDCIQLKENLLKLCEGYGRRVIVRISCHELEAWYWGDLKAVSAAFGKDLTKLERRRQYRNPDMIVNPKQELKKYLPQLLQLDGARKIAPHMNIQNNTSHSFEVFVRGVQNLCQEAMQLDKQSARLAIPV